MSQPKVSNQSQAAGSDTEADPEVVVRGMCQEW
jgi:hypothetical protein